MITSWIGRAVCAVALVLGCEDSASAVDPAWGKQGCASCSMIVSDPRYAAELVTSHGERSFFDDPGCLAAYVIDHAERAPRSAWVRTEAGAWIDTAAARFDPGAHTPMDYGFAVAEHGALDWAAVVAAVRARKEAGRNR